MRQNGNKEKSDTPAEQPVDPRIVRFIGRHRVMTLAAATPAQAPDSSADIDLWCCNLFYAYLSPGTFGFAGGAFVFTSPQETRHAGMFASHPQAAGSIVLESRLVGRLQGLQFQGRVVRTTADGTPALFARAKSAYLKRFPFAATMLSDLWLLEITRLKYTDNTLGFGAKLHWPRATADH